MLVLAVFIHLRLACFARVPIRDCDVISDRLKCTGPDLPPEAANFTFLEWNVQNRTSINRQDFERARNLFELRIAGPELTSLDDGVFETMANLINLTITGTNVSEISTLRGLDRLENLNLSSNAFKKLDDVIPALIELPSLRHVSLSGNEITSVTQEMVDVMASLDEVDLTGNPLRCDCGLKPMRPYIFDYRTPKRRVLFIGTGYCHGPGEGQSVAKFMTGIYKMHCSAMSELTFSACFALAVGLIAGTLAVIKQCARRVEERSRTKKKIGEQEKQKLPGSGLQANSPLLKENCNTM